MSDEAHAHLEQLFTGLEGFVALAVGFGGHWTGNGKYEHRSFAEDFYGWPEQADAIAEKAGEYAPTADIYVCPLLRRERGRKQGTGTVGRFAWADLDLDPAAPSGWERALLGPSSFVVSSGRGLHPYLWLPEPLPAAELEHLNQRLATALGADAGWSETKYLRLAGTANHKEEPPLPVRFVELARAERDWTLKELDELLPEQGPNVVEDAELEATEPTCVPAHLLARLNEEAEYRSKASYTFISGCLAAGLDKAETLWLAQQHKPTVDKYGRRAAREIARTLGKPGAQPIPMPEWVSEWVVGSGSPPSRDGAVTGPIPPIPPIEESVRESVAVAAPSAEPVELAFQSAAVFAAEDEPSAEMVMGFNDDDAAFVAGGTVIVFGQGGGGKTTLVTDISCHVATGTEWHGLKVPTPRRVAVVENDGPRGRFRRKVRAKLAAWRETGGNDLGDKLEFLAKPWGKLKLSREDHRTTLAAYISENEVDVLIAGPIVSLVMIGGGTPDEVAAFEAHLQALRDLLERPLLVVLLHHTNQRGQISGAWDRVPETLMLAVNTGKSTRLVWQKARDSSTLHATTWKLKWAPGMAFELDDTPDVTEDDIEEGILAAVLASPGKSWTTVAKDVKGNAKTKAAVRDRLIREGRLVNRGKGQAFALWHRDDAEFAAVEGEEQITLVEIEAATIALRERTDQIVQPLEDAIEEARRMRDEPSADEGE